MSLLPELARTAKALETTFAEIPAERKQQLHRLSNYISQKRAASQTINLVFICTHNSRRSHMAQLWAQAAAAYYNIRHVHTFSGGTEATAFYPAAVEAMQELGFEIKKEAAEANPRYMVKFADDADGITVWSKRFDDAANPTADFAAIMTCSDADQNCPFVPGAEQRIALTYTDPKLSDNTAHQLQIYKERALQIGREMLFAFSEVTR
ncbi:low molecular weight phosphatase family protein [Pontibacter burrus]|uniref:Protein-tyrosine-phosphatase n=1 Tax=Pontibacter burrus TaxID=2704466 RepID=A0A6B3LSC9_9BACT|nr:protein-tyrosine-phosphatase [Pontibacter burrus]NEM97116.1 protein-tyrosine-phosphatase [Pontibacter burrus]